MYDSLEEVQKCSALKIQEAFSEALRLGKDSFFLLEVVRTIGMDEDTKYRSDMQLMDKFDRRELKSLGFNTILTHFTISPNRDRYIANTIYHVLDIDQVVMIDNIKEYEFQKYLKLIDDPKVLIAVKSSREHAKRLLSGRRSKTR